MSSHLIAMFTDHTPTAPFDPYEGCPGSFQPFWIPREPIAWPWCNLTASQRRPYCASVNSHSPVGLVSRQRDAVDILCTVWPSYSKWPSEQISSTTIRLPILQLSCRLFWQSITSPRSCQSPSIPDLALCDLWLISKLKSLLKGRRFVIATVTHYIVWMMCLVSLLLSSVPFETHCLQLTYLLILLLCETSSLGPVRVQTRDHPSGV
jgi:hypothetical protein